MKKLLLGLFIILSISFATTSQIMNLYKSGFIKRIEIKLHTVYINPYQWAYLNIDQKKQFCIIMDDAFKKGNNSNITLVEVKSYISDKKLAGYSAWGFKVY